MQPFNRRKQRHQKGFEHNQDNNTIKEGRIRQLRRIVKERIRRYTTKQSPEQVEQQGQKFGKDELIWVKISAYVAIVSLILQAFQLVVR